MECFRRGRRWRGFRKFLEPGWLCTRTITQEPACKQVGSWREAYALVLSKYEPTYLSQIYQIIPNSSSDGESLNGENNDKPLLWNWQTQRNPHCSYLFILWRCRYWAICPRHKVDRTRLLGNRLSRLPLSKMSCKLCRSHLLWWPRSCAFFT